MDLVPRCHVNSQFQEHFEQLYREIAVSPSRTGSYKDLCFLLHKYCKVTDQLLVVGCREDGSFFGELYDAGYRSVTSVESSSVNVEMHTLKTGLNSDFFNVVLDRGVIDTQFKDQPTQSTNSNVTKYFEDIQTLLKVGGRYLCFTYAPADILDRLLDYFSSGWFFRVHWLYLEVSYKRPALLPVFLFVLTKTTFAGSSSYSVSVLEMCLSGIDNIFRVKSLLEVKSSVQEIQQYFIVKKLLERICPGQHINIDLFPPVANEQGKHEHRYSMTAVDISKKCAKNGVFAIFIVPQGRETEWLFASDEGQKELANNAGFERLVIATLERGHTFSDMGIIKKELSARVMELAPIGLSCDTQVPFLSIGDDIGNRVVLHEGNSTFSGNFVVEDVDGDSGMKFRRLIFLSNKNVIQSEARLFIVKEVPNTRGKKNRGKQKKKSGSSIKCRVDHGYLACQHHRIIVSGLALVEGFLTKGARETKKCLLVGLGGGGLAMFLHQHFRQLSLEVVELDPSISEIAKCWFEFKEDERMNIIIQDGVEYIKTKESQPSYHVIIFDVDSKDTSVGMSCPPESFVDKTFLSYVQSLLHPSGVFILNLVCRNASLKKRVVADLHSVFCELYSVGIEGEVNEIIIALPLRRYQTQAGGNNSDDTVRNSIRESVKELQRYAKTEATCWDSSLDLCKLTEGLQII